MTMPIDDAPFLKQDLPPKGLMSERGYSDSMVPSCRVSPDKERQILQDVSAETNLPIGLGDDVAGNWLLGQKKFLVSSSVKARQNLQLPSFKSLGLGTLQQPSALLTPPDESILVSLPPASANQHQMAPTNSFHIPLPIRPDILDLAGSSDSQVVETSSFEQSNASVAETMEQAVQMGRAGRSSDSEGSDAYSERAEWVMNAVETVVANVTGAITNVVNVLCHSQPCPLANEGNVTTASTDIMAAVQAKVNATGRYIEVTHAVPAKFNMNQVPSSPAATPSARSSANIPADYFSMNVFSKAVVAMDHRDALLTSVPSSPHPVVAPSSITVSLLERFIPPSSRTEYMDLFSSDAPSVLVDRLVELSPDGGSLLFIYPTASGGNAFASRYLGPLLDPLLRTLVGIHGLSADVGASIGKMYAVDSMLPFEAMARKINLLLRKLGRGTSSVHHPPPKLTVVQSSKQIVDLGRSVWMEWWVHQEAGRIRAAMDTYFQRGRRLPTNRDMTAGGLSREILDGVKTRTYAEYDEARDGVEVGVFIIKRTG